MDDSLGKLFSIIHRNLRSVLDLELVHMDVGHGPRRFLVEITRHEGLSQEELSRRLLMDKTTTARAVKRLEDRGYVLRRRAAEDRRHYHLYPTEKARVFLPDILEARREIQAGLTEGLTSEETEALTALLRRVADNAIGLRKQKQARSRS